MIKEYCRNFKNVYFHYYDKDKKTETHSDLRYSQYMESPSPYFL